MMRGRSADEGEGSEGSEVTEGHGELTADQMILIRSAASGPLGSGGLTAHRLVLFY